MCPVFFANKRDGLAGGEEDNERKGGRHVCPQVRNKTYLNRLRHPISQPIGPNGLVTAVERRMSSRQHRASAGGRNTYQLSHALTHSNNSIGF